MLAERTEDGRVFQQDLCGIEASMLTMWAFSTNEFQQDLCGIEAVAPQSHLSVLVGFSRTSMGLKRERCREPAARLEGFQQDLCGTGAKSKQIVK